MLSELQSTCIFTFTFPIIRKKIKYENLTARFYVGCKVFAFIDQNMYKFYEFKSPL